MKRILSIIVILALAIGLAACGNKSAEKRMTKKSLLVLRQRHMLKY